MSDRPTPAQILEAVATVLEGTASAGEVVRDPLYSPELNDYAEMLLVSGVVDGWMVEFGPEEPETREPAGATSNFAHLLVTGMVQVDPGRTGGGSLAYFGDKVEQAKRAFRLPANEDLGFGAGVFRHYFLTAPNGYQRVPLDLCQVHLAPMELRYWTKGC